MTYLQSPVEQAARIRIAANPSLIVYYDIIFWGDFCSEKHYTWLLEASDAVILDWAEGLVVEWESEATDLGYDNLFGDEATI